MTPDDKRRLLPGDSSGDVEAGVLRTAPPPPWVELHQELVEEMERVQRKTEELKKLHRQHLLPGFDEDDRYSEEQQIDKLAREIAQSLQSCDLGVKQISAPGGQRRLSPQEARVRASAQTSLATRLHGLTKRYRKEQDSYISKLEKQQGGGDVGDAGGRGRSRLDPFADDDGDSGGGGLQSSQQLANANDEEIRFRDGEISKVARSVQEIATLMQDLAGLVIDQVCPAQPHLIYWCAPIRTRLAHTPHRGPNWTVPSHSTRCCCQLARSGDQVRSNRLQHRTDRERHGGRGQTVAEGGTFAEEVALDELHIVPACDVLRDGGHPLPQGTCLRVRVCCAMNASVVRSCTVSLRAQGSSSEAWQQGKQLRATHRGEMISAPAAISTDAARLLDWQRTRHPGCERTRPHRFCVPSRARASASAQAGPGCSESPSHGTAIALSSTFPTGSPATRASPRIQPRRNSNPPKRLAAFDHPVCLNREPPVDAIHAESSGLRVTITLIYSSSATCVSRPLYMPGATGTCVTSV